MNNIAKVALESKGFTNAEDLIRIAEATQNPTTALEIMLGIYETPIIAKESTYRLNAKFISFDPLRDSCSNVCFSYDEPKRKQYAYDSAKHDRKEIQALILTSDYTEPETFEKKETTYFDTTETTNTFGYCSVESWQKHAIESIAIS